MNISKQKEDLNKAVISLVDEFFGPVKKSSENFEVAPAAKTTADKVMSEVPGSENDEDRDAGRPKNDHDVPKIDKDGNSAKGYEAVQSPQAEQSNPEVNQAGASTQISSEGRLSEKPHMKDPRLSKSLEEDPEYKEFQAFKKAKVEADEKKKADDLKKAQTDLLKSAVDEAIKPIKDENEKLRKAFAEQNDLLKAIAGQPRQAKSITGIEALQKSHDPETDGPREFTKAEKLDAAERLFKAKQIPDEAVIELENTGTVYRRDWQQMIEKELEKTNS